MYKSTTKTWKRRHKSLKSSIVHFSHYVLTESVEDCRMSLKRTLHFQFTPRMYCAKFDKKIKMQKLYIKTDKQTTNYRWWVKHIWDVADIEEGSISYHSLLARYSILLPINPPPHSPTQTHNNVTCVLQRKNNQYIMNFVLGFFAIYFV